MPTRSVLGYQDGGSLEEVGGKAFNLARLTAAGLRVPEWCVIPTTTFEHERWKSEVRSWIADSNGIDRVAVRSSAVEEDGDQQSHAGQFVTLLDVPIARVHDAVGRCRAARSNGVSPVFSYFGSNSALAAMSNLTDSVNP